jgi:hypothetical protein
MSLFAVKRRGSVLKYILNQTHEMCLIALSRDSNFLKYVKNQTEDLCILSCKNNGLCIQYVYDPEKFDVSSRTIEENPIALCICGK